MGGGLTTTAMLPLHDRPAEIIRDLDRLKWMLAVKTCCCWPFEDQRGRAVKECFPAWLFFGRIRVLERERGELGG
jgi:hypothetical protein